MIDPDRPRAAAPDTAADVRGPAGDPTPAEVAALVAALGVTSQPTGPVADGWSGYWRSVRTPARPADGR